jgi:DNA-binding PadR family transcriptional regulator
MTNAELAILSLIAEKPQHGYQIEQVIEERGMREWTEVGFSSIYYLLKKLEKNGSIEGRVEQQAGRGPARTVYYITEAGEEAWHTAILEALSTPHLCYTPFLLALGNLPVVSTDEALAALQQYRDSLAERVAHIRGRLEAQRPLPYFVEAMFDYSLTLVRAELKWIEKFIKQLEEQNGKD